MKDCKDIMWRGVIIGESLEDKSLLKLVKIVESKRATLENEAEAGTLTFHKIELLDAKKEGFLRKARNSIKDKFYLHICKGGVMCVVYRDRVFEFTEKDAGKINDAREYGAAHGILREQLGFELLIDNPWV